MLKYQLLHPGILRACAAAGHHAKILIADGNYPVSTKKGPNASVIHLNLAPGIVSVSEVLAALLTAVPVDAVQAMGIPPDDPYARKGEPPVWSKYRRVLKESGSPLEVEPVLKWDFYKAVESPDHVLTIQTADQALWANLLLTLGCRTS